MNEVVLNHISKEFLRIKTKNPSFSLRALARRLGIQASALSEIMNKKRKISPKMARTVLTNLGLNPLEVEEIVLNKNTTTTSYERNLSLSYFEVISEWHYFALLSLTRLINFRSDYGWMAENLNISISLVKRSVEKLLELGLLDKDENGELYSTEINFATPTDIKNASLRNHSLESLEMAETSLRNDPIETRDFTEITMAIDTDKIPKAKQMISDFQDQLCEFLEESNQDAVYKMAVQLYPLSKLGGGSEE